MKKALSIAIVFLVLVFAIPALASFPAPFENAKVLAATQEAKGGVHQWVAKDPDSSKFVYIIGYDPGKETVSLVTIDTVEGIVTGLSAVKDNFYFEQFALTPFGLKILQQKELTQDAATELAFQFYRILVLKGLMPSLI